MAVMALLLLLLPCPSYPMFLPSMDWDNLHTALRLSQTLYPYAEDLWRGQEEVEVEEAVMEEGGWGWMDSFLVDSWLPASSEGATEDVFHLEEEMAEEGGWENYLLQDDW